MRILGLAALATTVVLGGCASKGLLSGDTPGVTETFAVQADADAAHRRASEFIRVCHEQRVHPYGVVYQSSQTLGEKGLPNEHKVFKQTEPAKILEIIRTEADGPANSRVTVLVLDEGIWDEAEVQAARASIQSATPVCRSVANR